MITFPEAVTEDLKQTIDDWFWLRTVCSDDNFNRFFNRTLEGALPRYNQLLRIQPGISEYDWLVQNYREAEKVSTMSGTSSKTGSNDKTLASTENGTSGNTRTMNTKDTTDRDTTKSETHGGTVTTRDDYGKTSTNSGTLKNTGDRTESGSIQDSGTTSDTSDQKTLSKESPQSVSYANASGGMPSGLDWSYPGAQAEVGTTGSGSSSNTRTFNNHKTADDFTQTDTRKNTMGGTDTRTETDARTVSGADTEDVTVDHTGTVTDAGTNSVTRSGSDNTEYEESTTTGNSGTDRTIETGRNIDIASLLSNAKQFIIGTTAWGWLKGELEACFLGIYDY